ncbi:hypothetical protein LR002_02115 [Candidatus Gracilibacteria bacterium]|nr:hypothetical protein [Candidatus Gracilibacteria bacterium]
MLKNLLKIISSPIGVFGTILGIVIIAIPEYYFMNSCLVIGNLGKVFYNTEIILTILNSILFGIFLGGTLYKIDFFSVKKSGIGLLGGFLGAIVSGCPACSITLASYLGLAGIISIFPYHGIELKFLSLFVLLYVDYSILKNLEMCELKIKK